MIEPLPPSPWPSLRTHTAARLDLARAGASLATTALLDLRLAHARARDAVHLPLDEPALLAALPLPALVIDSQASTPHEPGRQTYLMRPDLGRRLSPTALAALTPYAAPCNLVIVLSDGLSPQALQRHAAPLLKALLPAVNADQWTLAPLVLVRAARVAIADEIALTLGASAALILLGERPGLSAPDSLGAYLTWQPSTRTTDADRNCISNIRPEGLSYAEAAFRLHHLLTRMRTLRTSGITLKDESERLTSLPLA